MTSAPRDPWLLTPGPLTTSKRTGCRLEAMAVNEFMDLMVV